MGTPLMQCINPDTLLVTLALLFTIYLITSSLGPQRKEPPGPWPLPLLGNILQVNAKSPHSTLQELSKKYGPIFTVHFGPKKAVVLAGYKTIKETLLNVEAFAHKEPLPILKDLKLTYGVVFSNGETWKAMRQFAMANLKEFGMGKRENEEKIMEESRFLVDAFLQKEGQAFDNTKLVSYAVSNIICSFVYGKRFDYDDPVFTSMVGRASKNTQLMGSASVQLYNAFPWLFGWIGARKQLLKNALENRVQMRTIIEELRESLDTQMCRGFVDSFLARMIRFEASGKSNSHFHEDNLIISVVNLFTAGTDTTSSSIRYGLLLMAKYPKIQDQVQMELATVVGSRQARAEDRRSLPYTDAVIHEIQRFANTVPLVVRSASRDVTCQGYYIKKGTPLVVLLSSALQDEDEWENTSTFNPDHFLDKDGAFRKRDAFLAFSAGSRNCIGESVARMELFLFFTSLLQQFRFSPPPGVTEDELDLTPRLGLALTPPTHELCAISRN